MTMVLDNIKGPDAEALAFAYAEYGVPAPLQDGLASWELGYIDESLDNPAHHQADDSGGNGTTHSSSSGSSRDSDDSWNLYKGALAAAEAGLTAVTPVAVIPVLAPSNGALPQTGQFVVDPRPGFGQVRVNLFIAACESGLPGLTFKGDCRSFDRDARGVDSRGSITIDFETGQGFVYVNDSCPKKGACVDAVRLGVNPPPVGNGCGRPESPPTVAGCANATMDAHPPNSVSTSSDANGVSIGYSLVNSALPPGVPPPAINGNLRLSLNPESRNVSACFDGDNYPSMEVYQTVGGEIRDVARWSESGAGPVALFPMAANRKACS